MITTPVGSFAAAVDLTIGQVRVSLVANPAGVSALLQVPIQLTGAGTEFIEGVDPVSGEVLRFDNFFSSGQIIGFIETRLAVPEPTTATLLGAGGVIGWAMRRRPRARSQRAA